MKSLLINIIYIIEAFFLCVWITICRLIGIDFASSLGSKIIKCLGPLSKFDKRAEINLKKIFPSINAKEQQVIKKNMWDNLGRNIGELAFANKLNPYSDQNINSIKEEPRFSIVGKKYLEDIIQKILLIYLN